MQYASLATQIGTAARAEAPVRALKAISPNITKKRVTKPEPVPRYMRHSPHTDSQNCSLYGLNCRPCVATPVCSIAVRLTR